MKSHLYISRVDSGRKHGYYVRVALNRGERPKYFFDKSYGGQSKALKAAITYRDEVVSRLKLDRPDHVRNRRNRSGVTGVHLSRGKSGELYWRVRISGSGERAFSVKKYGYENAFKNAVDAKFKALRKKAPMIDAPLLKRLPATTKSTHYQNKYHVMKYVLTKANGICECCGKPAPFAKQDGTPYLEVHHMRSLREGGTDSIDNTVALCPNCHRELEVGMDREKLKDRLYRIIPRLSQVKI